MRASWSRNCACIWLGAGLPGLDFDQAIPHHSTFSKNRHGRFQESKRFEQLFEEIVTRCLEAGLVQGDNLSVDGSFVEANAPTTADTMLGTVPMSTSGRANVVVRVHKKPNAPVPP